MKQTYRMLHFNTDERMYCLRTIRGKDMIIRCTKKLLDKMNCKPARGDSQHEFFCWYANLLTINRHNTVVFCNEATGISIVISNLKAKDFKNLDKYFLQALEEFFEDCGIDKALLDCYMQFAGSQVSYRKTESRSMLNYLNKACSAASYVELLDENTIIQRGMNYNIRSRLFVVGGSYQLSDELFAAKLNALKSGGLDALLEHRQALYLRATLFISETLSIKRDLLVPARLKYSALHKIIQAAYGWQGYHLHEFTIYENGANFYNMTPKKRIIMHGASKADEAEMAAEDVVYENERVQADDLKDNTLLYTYDFGDGWEIELELIEEIADHVGALPCCIGGKEDAPPEDVGGNGGYLNFLEVINNPDNSEYQEMVEWGQQQGYERFNITRINARMKRIKE